MNITNGTLCGLLPSQLFFTKMCFKIIIAKSIYIQCDLNGLINLVPDTVFCFVYILSKTNVRAGGGGGGGGHPCYGITKYNFALHDSQNAIL